MNEDDSSISRQPPDNPTTGARTISVVRAESTFHFGPLPSPEVLRKYQEIDPTIVPAIISAFAEQGNNRRSNEKWVYRGGVVRSILGVLFAFIIGMTALVGGLYLVINNHGIEGTIFGGIGLAGLVNAFLLGTRHRQKELSEAAPPE